MQDTITVVEPDGFEPGQHFYPRTLNAQIHPVVRYMLTLGNARLAQRYIHLHPEADPDAVRAALAHRTTHFRWGGTDLLHATTEEGIRRLVVIETNSCPSGQKSMPILSEDEERGGYKTLLERSFVPALKRRNLPRGGLAVLFDKNPMEITGYAATLADLTGEPVFIVPCFDGKSAAHVRFDDGVLHICVEGQWEPIRAAFRYVTQRPWNRIPPLTKTLIYNPTLVCLAGGRNKMLAAKAYDFYNATIERHGLKIWTPETIWDVSRQEVPLWVSRMGGVAVVKVPYSNAGQGVFTITNPEELEAFMDSEGRYDRYIVQALIGNRAWSSRSKNGRLYHVGTMPNRKENIFVADLRFMVGVGPDGFFPVAIYARRARKPLLSALDRSYDSWAMLGTNLSVRDADGNWATQSERLMLMDQRDFNHLGMGLDDLIEGYIQTVLAMTAIDDMSIQLTTQKRRFRKRFFARLNDDDALIKEITE